jgi:dTDP-4-dehydrorhamnose reductase
VGPRGPHPRHPWGVTMAGVLVFGATSLVGSHFAANPPEGVVIAAAGRRSPERLGIPPARFDSVDLHDAKAVEAAVADSPEPVVVNFAARTDVDGIERERPAVSGADPTLSNAYRVNALAPEAMARGARSNGKFLITISTDFIFDGQSGPYSEGAPPDPLGPLVSWYGWTKGEGERRVHATLPQAAIIRISYPYRPPFGGKSDFAGWVREKGRAGALPPLYTDQQITPTWIPDVTNTVGALVAQRRPGTFHVASPTLTTPHGFATSLLEADTGQRPELATGSLAKRLLEPGVTPRPVRGGLTTGAAQALGCSLTSWEDGVKALAGVGRVG